MGLAAVVEAAVRAVCDPEYPDLTIAELGIFESVRVDGAGGAHIELVPTVLACPALRTIEQDVVDAALGAGAASAEVVFLTSPRWSPARIDATTRAHLGREYTVAIRGLDGRIICPVCGGREAHQRAAFGPALCRETWWCDDCRNPVEVVREAVGRP
ncbi:MAG: iron-sulfur cluster assembly protein [Acidimicrobiia bacterium]|nr:iron-sulfur cluster assembly protein [Acidimicrobiia bacterium]